MNINPAAPGRHPHAPACPSPDSVREVAARLDSILGSLLLLIAAQFRRLGLHTAPLWTRISRARQRLARLFTRLAERLAEGHLPRPHTPRPGRPGGPKPVPLPQGYAWVVRIIGYHAAGYGSQLQFLLAEPAMQQAIAAAPSAARTLRPICRMLGIDLPPSLRPARPAAVGDATAPPGEPPNPPPRAPQPRPARPRFSLRPEPAPAPVIIVFPLSG